MTKYILCGHSGCSEPATFITFDGANTFYYCEQHGEELGMRRGIPVDEPNHAEPPYLCRQCHAPLEEGDLCAPCIEDIGTREDTKGWLS